MRKPYILLLIAFAVLACRSWSSARYLVTSSPIDVGLGIRLCVALDLEDEKGLWWWGEGASGCGSRSTGPSLFRGEQTKVTRPRGMQPGTATFRLATHSAERPHIDVKLLVEGRTLHALETNDRVTLEDRHDLAIPEKPMRGEPPPRSAQDSLYFVPADRVAVRVMSDIPPIELAPGLRVRTVVGSSGSFSLAEFETGAAAPLHHHTREQVDIGISGVLDVTLGNHAEILKPGAAVIVPSNVAHSIANKQGAPGTLIEFHTVPRPDLVPPRAVVTYPAGAKPVAIPDRPRLVVELDEPVKTAHNALQILRGQTCMLQWRHLERGAAPTDVHPTPTRAEVFVYVLKGSADLSASGQIQRVNSGSLVVIPGSLQRVTLQAVGGNRVTLAEFSSERR